MIAAGKSIYCVDSKCKVLVAERPDTTLVMQVYNDSLYDAGMHGCVYNTLDDTVVAERSVPVRCLASHLGSLYDAGDNNMVARTFNPNVQWFRQPSVRHLCPHAVSLYEADSQGNIRMAPGDAVVSVRRDVRALLSDGVHLYDAGVGGVFETLSGQKKSHNDHAHSLGMHKNILYHGGEGGIWDTVQGNQIAWRGHSSSLDCVWNLVSCAGKMYDSALNKVYETFVDTDGTAPLWSFDDQVQVVLGVPIALWEKLAKKGKIET